MTSQVPPGGDPHALEVHRDYAVGAERVFGGFVGAYDDPRPEWVLKSECHP